MWRYETKATRPFIRSREFYWIESHDAFATREEAEAQVREDMQMSVNVIFGQFGVPFMFFTRPQWDKFPGALFTYAADCIMPDGRVLQLPSTHLLGQNFAKPFDVKYLNEKGESEYVWQTCYGPAISRIYAAIISTHGDDNGLVLPYELAPVQVAIIPIIKKGSESVVEEKAKGILALLKQHDIRAEADFSQNTPGFKYNEWELKGAAFRVELGAREAESGILTVMRRDNKQKQQVKEADLVSWLGKEGKAMLSDMKKKSVEKFDSTITKANSMDGLASQLKEGRLVAIPFCSMEKDGKPCGDAIKEKTAGDVRGSRYDGKDNVEGNCVVCGKKASAIVYVARQY